MATPSVSPISLAVRDHVRDVLGIFASNPLYCRVSGEFDPEAMVVEEVEAYLRKDLGRPGCHVELARIDQGAAVALLSVLTRHPQDGLPWIMELIVHGKAQGRGIGKSLAALAEDRFRAMGAERARLCTFGQMSSSREFWSALGWRVIRHNTRNQNGQSVMVMEKSLVLA